MKRRDLLSGGVQAIAGTPLVAHAALRAQSTPVCDPCAPAPFPATPSPLAKLRIKPIMTNMIHSGVWEGPCRFNVVTPAQEREQVQKAYAGWVKALREGQFPFGAGAQLLDPSLVTFNEDFTLPAAAFAELDRDAQRRRCFFHRPFRLFQCGI